jgi:hypothetical protein
VEQGEERNDAGLRLEELRMLLVCWYLYGTVDLQGHAANMTVHMPKLRAEERVVCANRTSSSLPYAILAAGLVLSMKAWAPPYFHRWAWRCGGGLDLRTRCLS